MKIKRNKEEEKTLKVIKKYQREENVYTQKVIVLVFNSLHASLTSNMCIIQY